MKAGGSSAFDSMKSMWSKTVPGAGGNDTAELTEEERENLREVFDQIDDDGSGEVRYRSVYCAIKTRMCSAIDSVLSRHTYLFMFAPRSQPV